MTKRGIAIIIAGFFTVSIAYSIRYAYGMLLPEMLPALAMSKTQAGLIFAAYFLIYTTCTPLLGALSDIYSYRTILAVFTAILGSGAWLMAFAGSYLQASLIFALAAFGHSACWAPVMVLVQKWVPDHKRGTALSFVAMGVGSGIFAWGLILPLIVTSSGWRSGWTALGITALVIAIGNALLVRNPPISASEKSESRQSLPEFILSYRTLFKQWLFWAIGLAYLLVGFNVIILFTFLPVYSQETLNVPYATATGLISVIAFFGIVGQLLLGPLSDKIGRMKVMISCSVIMGFSCLAFLLIHSIYLLYVVTAFYGIGYGAVWPIYAAAASDYFPRRHSGGIIGLWTLCLGLGSIVGPVLSGWIIDNTGDYTGVFACAMIAGFISVLLLLTVARLPKVAVLHRTG